MEASQKLNALSRVASSLRFEQRGITLSKHLSFRMHLLRGCSIVKN